METVSKPESGMASSYILSIIGGAIMILGGVVTLPMMNRFVQTGMMGFGTGGMMGGGGMMSGIITSSVMWTAFAIMTGVSAGLGAVLIVGGYSIQKKPESASSWGVTILIASIVGLVTMIGFFIGPILGIIGGILALTTRPQVKSQ
jgi:hypothetical protein